MKPGTMHRNGHAQCGGCAIELDRCAGGRRARKARGWTYTGPHRLGWVCESCAPWVARRLQELQELVDAPNVEKRPYIVDKSDGARGFGVARPETGGVGKRLRHQRRKAAQRARRRAGRAENRAAGRAPHERDLDRVPSSVWRQLTRTRKSRRE